MDEMGVADDARDGARRARVRTPTDDTCVRLCFWLGLADERRGDAIVDGRPRWPARV